ncbi:hypothetical protein EMPS_10824 [Entomortierella parvispora]|uniref:Calcineurin-like phosphoesterase domain-containing protein n=1 Tax=Entomortierella parvispora TaxID=205924 RepID=A0A9P3HKL6_9FUNG|nr:hypothetical protein EMPS_10824 [Entomortierella parvispora]
MFSSIFSRNNAPPAPRTFEIIHPVIPEPKQDIGTFPPNVYLASDAPSKKPAANWLRMICISDTHNTTDINNYPIPDADVLVHAGDLTKMGTTAQIEQVVHWLQSLKHIPLKVVIAGNHDVILHKEFYEKNWNRFHDTKEDHDAAVNKLRSAGHGIVYLNNQSYTVNGAQFLHLKQQWQQKTPSAEPMDVDGTVESMDVDVVAEVDPRQGWRQGYHIWASPWQPEFGNWAFNGVRGKLMEIWKHIPLPTDLLMTHGPPMNHRDIVYEGKDAIHVGCEELLERLQSVRPLYHIFGHIHEGYGISEIKWDRGKSPSTVCINASSCTERYRPTNQPIIVDLPPK